MNEMKRPDQATRSGKRSGCKSAILLLTVSAVCFGLAEFVARGLPKNYYEWKHRYMFVSEGVNTNKTFADGTSAQWYKPNSAINWHVFYGYPGQKPKAEYSIWSTTNNIGLVQSRDFNPTKKSIAVFGDSFTEPQATTPWFYNLENDWGTNPQSSDTQLLNFGYQGTGIGRWDQISKNLSEGLNIKKAIYVVIGQDFARLNRGGWNDQDLQCLSDSEQCRKHYYQSIAGNKQSEEELTDRASNLMNKRHRTLDKRLRYGLCGKSELIRQISSIIGTPCFDGKSPTQYQKDLKQAVGHGLAHFRDHIDLYGKENVGLVWIPERNEAATGQISPISKKALNVANNLLPNGHVIKCDLKSGDYYEKDGHQNERGSNKIYKCTRQMLSQITSQSSK